MGKIEYSFLDLTAMVWTLAMDKSFSAFSRKANPTVARVSN
ncbi:hypothetical protein [Bernardetia sp. MNP-M8]